MNKRLKITTLVLAICLLVLGAILFVSFRSNDSQLNQTQNQAEAEREFLPDQPSISTSLIQSADQLAETRKSYNITTENQAPSVNYASQTLVAFIYQAPTPGYKIEVASSSSAAQVTVTSPPKGCVKPQVVTPVVAFAVVSRTQSLPTVNSQLIDSTAECNFQ